MPSKPKQQEFPPIEEFPTAQMPVEKLVPYAGNPRRNDHAVDQMAGLIKRFGFRVPILAKSDGQLIDGHLRIKAANKLGLETVPAILCDDMSENDIKALRLSVNRAAELAEWDMDLLKVELGDLQDAGFELEEIAFDMGLLDYDPVGDESKDDDRYISKIDAPVYEPTEESPPHVSELFDSKKTSDLIADIDGASIPDDLKDFLRCAAYRHTKFNFSKIAEFFAHQKKPIRDLFESSALVIIDYDKAIAEGYTTFTKEVEKSFESDYPDE